MTGKPRTTFAKLQRERARQAKQAAKRARRQGTTNELGPLPVEPAARDDSPAAETAPAETKSEDR